MKIALVHDWLVTVGGAEKVLSEILTLYPDADIFSIIDFIPDQSRHILRYKKVKTSFIQKLPFAKKHYRMYLPLMTYAIEQFDLSKYDLIISSSHAVAKGVLTSPNQLHICYCHTPMRYAWDLQHQYLQESNATSGVKSIIMRWLLHKIRIWDLRTTNSVNYFISNSNYIAKRIYKYYRRDATTIYPNVDTAKFIMNDKTREDFYLTASRFVPYKKIDLIVKTFQELPNKKLIVVGTGPEFNKIKQLASPNVELLGFQDDKTLVNLMQTCKAFIFAAEEDFGITPLEAQSCGTPVIAYGRGGSLETVIDINQQKPTGILFYEQTVDSIINAINQFEINQNLFNPIDASTNAQRFSSNIFRQQISEFVTNKIHQHLQPYLITASRKDISQVKVSVCIPTLNAITNASKTFIQLLSVLKSANLYRLLIIDSSSADNTVEIAKNYGFEIHSIPANEFDHGATRQLAANLLSDSDYIIYLTHDVSINNNVSIENLIHYTINNNLAAAYGRQVPHLDAHILAKHLRKFNYGSHSYIRSFDDRHKYGLKSAFSSNSFAIYNREALLNVGGFPNNTLFGEDMYAFSRLLISGYKIGYCAEALVWHSHNYSVKQNFKRYFDTGVFHTSCSDVISQFGTPEKEGRAFALSEFMYLLKYNILYIPSFVLNTIAKYLGYRLGVAYKHLTIKTCKRLSMHSSSKFWQTISDNRHNI